jgi:antitoxin CptB
MFFRRLFSAANFEREISKKKMKYLATKRGIVENELIFDKFITTNFDCLDEAELILFNEFLLEYDWDIFAWITGQRKVPEKYCNSNLFKLLKESTIKK